MTRRDYLLYEAGYRNKIKTWYNILPISLFSNQLATFENNFKKAFSGKDDLREQFHERSRMVAHTKIVELIALYDACHFILVHVAKVNQMRELIGKKSEATTNLKRYIERIEELTGIKVNSIEDLDKLKEKIEFLTLKYQESAPKQDSNNKSISFAELISGIELMIEREISQDTSLFEIAQYLRQAEARARAQKQHNEKLKNGRS
jgi:hypothetical protein